MLSHHAHRRPSLRTTARSRGQHGYVMVMFALLLVPLLLMVGFAVDVGYWYNRASDIRRAADAAALAGVVWLPDVDAARSAALEAAARNGFVPGGNISIDVEPSEQSERRLRVTIRDSSVGSFFYKSIAGKTIPLERTAFAEYVLSVPMGSPRNFFGTGTLLENYTATGIPAEYLYQSVNPYCTDKVNGDRFQSGYAGGTCSGTANGEYRTDGYEMYIEAPDTRTAPIEVRLYDARYNESDISWEIPGGEECSDRPAYTPADPDWTGPTGSSSNVTITGPAQYETRSWTGGSWGSTITLAPGQTYTRAGNLLHYRQGTIEWSPAAPSWTGPTGSTSNVTINGLAEYQTRSSKYGSWSSTQTLDYGSSVTRRRNLIRYRFAFAATEQYCVPTTTTVTDSAVDDKRQSGDETYTYTLYAADNTPLNDEDNPQICQKTFTRDTAFDGYEYLGSRRWNTLCTIASTATSGRYILRVQNEGAITSPEADGSNQWGLVAKYTGAGDGLCDGRNDSLCPRVYGRDAISVRAAANTQVASFYLAEIDRQHAGKKLKLELFDPGEGGQKIEIMKPTGTGGNTWTPASFSWKAAGVSWPTSASNVTSIDVTNSKFNGHLIEITIDLTGYDPPLDNQWWQIRYTFGGTVTDRTTWSARIIGDPVHLVEEH